MKPLKEMNNLDKGKMLFDLFPEHRQSFVESLKEACEYFEKYKNEEEKEWTPNSLITFEFWFQLSETILKSIIKNTPFIYKKKGVFVDQLFDGYIALFTIDQLIKYSEQSMDFKFKNFVKSIF